MGRLKPKGKAGAAKAYMTRTAAVKKLQCSLADFRRLCILKGIYPREPRSKKKANKGNSAPTTFYYAKDIAYLQHEPVLRKLREHKAFAKKLSRALGRGEWSIAKSLEENKPTYSLDVIIKERYPTFIDALRDIDDALCLVALFSFLPSDKGIPPSLVENTTRLYNEWLLYVMNTGALKKTFLSIKGVYYQAIVQGETVNWVVPWGFTQSIPPDVDTRILLTFLELYQTLLSFVFFKLYTDEGWQYPPPLDTSKDSSGAGVGALGIREINRRGATDAREQNGTSSMISGKSVRKAIKEIDASTSIPGETNSSADAMEVTNEPELDDEDFVQQTSSGTIDPSSSLPTFKSITASNNASTSKLFSGLVFWLSRETPRGLLEFVIRSFGGKVGWPATMGSGSLYNEDESTITHVIVDRPAVAGQPVYISSGVGVTHKEEDMTEEQKAIRRRRKYIQPQWVVDCVNAGAILSEDRYERGKVLPPHLSPFGEDKGAYEPILDTDDTPMEGVQHEQIKPTTQSGDEDDSDEEEVILGEEEPDQEEEDEDSDEEPTTPKVETNIKDVRSKGQKQKDKALRKAKQHADEEALRAAELEAEAAGVDFAEFQKAAIKGKKSKTKDGSNTSSAPKNSTEKEEEKGMNKMMMSNKQRKLYEKMKYGEQKREKEKATLEQKKASIQKAKKKEKARSGI